MTNKDKRVSEIFAGKHRYVDTEETRPTEIAVIVDNKCIMRCLSTSRYSVCVRPDVDIIFIFIFLFFIFLKLINGTH